MAATAESVLKPDFQATPQALHLHRRARTAARVDHATSRSKSSRRTPRSGRRRRSPTRSSRAWASSASSASTSPSSTAGRAATTSRRWCSARRSPHANCGGLAMGVAVQTDMAMPPILAFGTEEQKQQWVVPAIKGEKILCLGITEPDAGSDVKGIKTRAVRDGDDFVINGSKTYITNGHRARRDRARHQDRPRRRLRRLHACSSCRWTRPA